MRPRKKNQETSQGDHSETFRFTDGAADVGQNAMKTTAQEWEGQISACHEDPYPTEKCKKYSQTTQEGCALRMILACQ